MMKRDTNIYLRGGGNKSKSNKNQMPMCTYGAGCTRSDCVYRHPPPPEKDPDAPVCMPFISGYCTFGTRCTNRHPHGEEAAKLRAKCAQTACKYLNLPRCTCYTAPFRV